MKLILIILAIIYVLSPYDILPDFIVGWGWLDDLGILGILFRYLYFNKRKQAYNKQSFEKANQSSENNQGQRFSNKRASGSNTQFEKNPFDVLGIERDSSEEEIKKAYRKMASKYHPDKVVHLGNEFQEIAEKRFKEVQQAYEVLKKK
ncbi:MAG: DnaJ domain-containing protein [Deltaproteobacteria bacterium]|nr:DnaJ domain-containing protein [Deltaproteobacteria bacterium]NNK84953.1 DnaJ domain-containing protein [Desulfobacterales bacterium]